MSETASDYITEEPSAVWRKGAGRMTALAHHIATFTLAQRLYQLRVARRWSVELVADKCSRVTPGRHVTPAHVKAWESGERVPCLPTLWRLARVYGCTVVELRGGDGA